MIRRMFWLTLGAVVGIAGYRRLTRAARVLLSGPELLPLRGSAAVERRAIADSPWSTSARKTGAGTVAFVRDVRAGMADYMDRHRDI